MVFAVRHVRAFFLVFFVVLILIAGRSNAAIPPSDNTTPGSCIIARFTGKATTYSPLCEKESWSLSTGGRYNPQGWEAALQLDLAKKHNCGYKGRCYAVVENTANGRAAILLINDNGPLYSGSYGNKGVVIDLNEASMRYLANDPAGARFGNCKGVIPRVNVAILCRLIGQPGPLKEQDRAEWNKIVSAIPATQLPSNILSQSPNAGVLSGYPNTVAPQASAPSAQQLLSPSPAPVPIAANQPLPQPISASILTASSPTLEETEGDIPRSKTVSELLAALARPTTSRGVSPIKSPFKLSETVGGSNAAHLSSGSASSTSQNASSSLNPPPSTNTFSSTYRSPDLRWSTPTLFQPLWRDVEMIVRSLIDLLKRF